MIAKFTASDWYLRDEALRPCAVLALGERNQTHLLKWLAANAYDSAHYEQLNFSYPDPHAGTCPAQLIWLSAEGLRARSVLPWFDGALYVGAEPSCVQLWLPSSHAPRLPAQWLHAAAQRRTGAARHLIWPSPALLVALP